MQHVSLAGPALRLDTYLSEGVKSLGPIVLSEDIRSAKAPFRTCREYRTTYPSVVVEALLELYMEYNKCFGPLVAANRDTDTDYQFCVDGDGQPLNRWVQIDMVGLPQRFLEVAASFSVTEVKEALRRHIFEIENSLAMYQLLERVTPSKRFRTVFRQSLDELRRRHGRKIALLAVTDDKYRAMKAEEFGLGPDEALTDALVSELSGFDRLFHPEEFRRYVEACGGESEYLLYVRSSDPVAKLKKPGTPVEHPLLGDPELRKFIRAHTLTFNIDDPEADPIRAINDTKAYMPPMGMAFGIADEADYLTTEFQDHLKRDGNVPFTGNRLQPALRQYLEACGADIDAIMRGEQALRAKPLQGTYGCYGHHSVRLTRGKDRSELRADLRKRGRYVMQPELPTPFLVDPAGGTYQYIDRNFVTMLDGKPVFMGGFRSLLPHDSNEARQGRFHGNSATVWAAID